MIPQPGAAMVGGPVDDDPWEIGRVSERRHSPPSASSPTSRAETVGSN